MPLKTRRYNPTGTLWEGYDGITDLVAPSGIADGFQLDVTKPVRGSNIGCRVPRVNLQTWNGDFNFSSPGQVASGLLITGRANFGNIPNATLRDCVVLGGPTSAYGTQWTHVSAFGTSAKGRLVEFVDIEPSHPTVDSYGFSGWGYTVQRSSVVDVVDAFNVHRSPDGSIHSGQFFGNYSETKWYATDPRQNNGSHNDQYQLFSGSEIIIRGSAHKSEPRKGNGAVFTPNSTTGAAQLKNTQILNNWWEGCYTHISAWINGSTSSANVFDAIPGLVIRGNRHGNGSNGSAGDHQWDILITQRNYDLRSDISGNVRDPGGAPISPYINS